MKFPKINVKKWLVKVAKAFISKHADEIESKADAVIDTGADKLKGGVRNAVKKAKSKS